MLETQIPLAAAPKAASPASIQEQAERRLRRSSSIVLRNVACEFQNGVLTLRGHLPSYYHKQVAQELVLQINGVERIENQIEVIPPDSSTWLG